MKMFQRFVCLISLFFPVACMNAAEGDNDFLSGTVSGQVRCGDTPLAGVVVSDGVTVTLTDENGKYSIAHGGSSYVFISVPSGFTVPSNGIIPQHYHNIYGGTEQNVDFELQKMDDPEKFTFVAIADVHLTGDKTDKDLRQFRKLFMPDLKAAVESISGNRFVVDLGDMTTDHKWYSNNFYFPQFLEEFDGFPAPVYHIMGNHDNDPQTYGDTDEEYDANACLPYKKFIGPNYYSFNVGKVHFLMLDNIVSKGPYKYEYCFDEKQLEWISRDLSYVSHDVPVVVCMHVPYCKYVGVEDGGPVVAERVPDSRNMKNLIEMLAPYKEVHILTGHDHRNRTIQIADNIIEHNLASASAISWKLNDVPVITHDGTRSGYQIFEVDGDKISWAYKAVGYTVNESQFRAYDMNEVPAEYGGGKNEVLINVFNWDPEWRVSVYEDGNPVEVHQVYAKDPLYSLIRDETRMFDHRPDDWRAVNTVHMFSAVPAAGTSVVTVVVRDRFGNEYRENMVRPKPFSEDMR